MVVVMPQVLAKHCCGMPLVDDQDSIEQFTADGADEAFGDGVVPSRRLPLIPTVGPEPSG
jgi:hypothetical protein